MEKEIADHKFNLFYGILDNNLKHISEVANGLKCGCICPACDTRLVARNGGRKRIHHFAHYESAECKYGVQTSIHYAAKEILEKAKKIKIPSLDIFLNTEIERVGYILFSHGEFKSISVERYIDIDSVTLEKKLHKYIPDVVIVSKGKRLIIEIAVTHFVGRNKLNKIQESKISAIEIDLSKIENDFNLQELEPLIIDNVENKEWLYNEYGNEKRKICQVSKTKEIKELNDKNQRTKEKLELKEKKEKEKEEREKWYEKYFKPVVNRQTKNGLIVKQIENCPLQIKEYNGQYYASVKTDCANCKYSRWLRNNDKYLVCLFDYYKAKQDKAQKNSL
jgi:hypothetical protein